eukprot:SAG31_NODE_7754_length_1603_cov_1.092420_2_plen_215_part_00
MERRAALATAARSPAVCATVGEWKPVELRAACQLQGISRHFETFRDISRHFEIFYLLSILYPANIPSTVHATIARIRPANPFSNRPATRGDRGIAALRVMRRGLSPPVAGAGAGVAQQRSRRAAHADRSALTPRGAAVHSHGRVLHTAGRRSPGARAGHLSWRPRRDLPLIAKPPVRAQRSSHQQAASGGRRLRGSSRATPGGTLRVSSRSARD